MRPVAIITDEVQNFLSSSDHMFLAMCRESKVSVTMGFQSMNGLLSELRDKDQILAILSNLNSRVYMNNVCPQTNEWASLDGGEGFFLEFSGNAEPGMLGNGPMDARITGWGGHQVKRRIISPESFGQLQGGNRTDGLAEAYCRFVDEGGVSIWRVFFAVDVSSRKRKWWKRFSQPRDGAVVTLP